MWDTTKWDWRGGGIDLKPLAGLGAIIGFTCPAELYGEDGVFFYPFRIKNRPDPAYREMPRMPPGQFDRYFFITNAGGSHFFNLNEIDIMY